MILAVDLGSTNVKAALFAEDGRRLGEASCPLPYEIQTASRAELSPEAVTECFFKVLKDVVASVGATANEIRRVSLTSQAQTFCVCDRNGNPVSPFLGWTDQRAEEEAEELQTQLGNSCHQNAGWAKVGAGHMLSKVYWWKKRNDFPEDCQIVSLPSYLAMQLGAAHVSDSNLAAMSGFYSVPDKTWWTAALEATGISVAQLGEIVEPGTPVPTQAEIRPSEFSDSLEIVFAGNDHTAGAVGCGCQKGRSILTLGTAGVYYRWAASTPGPFSSHGLWGPYPDGAYYELFHITHACSALDWADKFLFGKVDSPRFAEIAGKVTPCPDTPFFDPKKWGTDSAWSAQTTSEQMAYAVLEGIAFAMLACSGEAREAKEEEILIIGGGSRLAFWVQLLANTFQCPFTRSTRDGLDGAAILAGLNLADAPTQKTQKVIPEPAKIDVLKTRYLQWCEHSGNGKYWVD